MPAYAAFVDWEDLAARARAAGPVDRLQHWLRQRSQWQLVVVSAVISVVYLRWGNVVRLATTILGPEHKLLPRMVALWLAAGIAAVLAVSRFARRT